MPASLDTGRLAVSLPATGACHLLYPPDLRWPGFNEQWSRSWRLGRLGNCETPAAAAERAAERFRLGLPGWTGRSEAVRKRGFGSELSIPGFGFVDMFVESVGKWFLAGFWCDLVGPGFERALGFWSVLLTLLLCKLLILFDL
ncbi:hypothetical protein, partial [Leisingera sp. ANG-DT]|uniref:hypothetical protein n=1 Tax=Leisingera sp. ANG-DT TaxID=1577897 RepID=UPI0019D38CBE